MPVSAKHKKQIFPGGPRLGHSGSFRSALQLFQEGRLSEAASLLLTLTQIEPRNGDAFHLLGLVSLQQGDHEKALAYIKKAGEIVPTSPLVANSLGAVLNETGRNSEAIEAYRRAISLEPRYAEAHNNLGNALKAVGRLDEAAKAYAASLAARPGDPGTLINLAGLLTEMGNQERAVDIYQQVVVAVPSEFRAYYGLGNALRTQGKPDQAVDAYRRAIQLRPDYPEAHYSLGNALRDLGMTTEAAAEYEQSIALKPNYAEAHNNLGNVLREQGLAPQAIAHYLSALSIKPDFAECRSNLGNALKDMGDIAGAMASYRQALASNPALKEAHSNLIYAKQFLAGTTLAEILGDHMEWNRRYVAPAISRRFEHPLLRLSPAPRLGFVSGDFRQHPVGYFTVGVVEGLSKLGCSITCYANQREHDGITQRFQNASHVWRDCASLSDDELSECIFRDKIEILFDLTGHNERNRLMVFARKPAPIQITWAGYMATTGVETIDYIIADRHEIPEESRRYYTEKVIEMPYSFVCYDPPAYAPPVSPPPSSSNGHVTFGCFNLLGKISPSVVDVWCEILGRVPTARLMLKTKELNSAETKASLEKLFIQRGIAPQKIELVGGTSHLEHLKHYGKIDIALDPFPFSGSTTTLESLWMGVPVITLPGETFASRHSLSFLSTLGLMEMIALDKEHYVSMAEGIAKDLPRIARIRSTLRERFGSSPLCDAAGFAAKLLQALRVMEP